MGITTASGIDFFHLGLLLVLIMVFITGIVICVAVVGVCCFHWLDGRSEDEDERGENKTTTPTPCQIRAQIQRLDQELSQQMERYKRQGKNFQEEGPPPYEALFPPPRTVSEHIDIVDMVPPPRDTRREKMNNCSAPHVYSYV